MIDKPKIGETVFVAYRAKPEEAQTTVVTKVGRKYFEAESNPYWPLEFDLETEHNGYWRSSGRRHNSGWICYRSVAALSAPIARGN